jgi:hypothetical protein
MHRNAAASRFHMETQPAASGDGGRYALKAIAHGANHDQKDTGRHDPCGGSHHACFLEQDFRSVWPDGTT